MRTTEKQRKAEAEEAKQKLLEWLKPGDTVFTTLRHKSASGMYRVIGCHVIKDNEPMWISPRVAQLVGKWDDRHEGVGVSGCGMDMGFHIVYELAYHLFGDGYALKHRWL